MFVKQILHTFLYFSVAPFSPLTNTARGDDLVRRAGGEMIHTLRQNNKSAKIRVVCPNFDTPP